MRRPSCCACYRAICSLCRCWTILRSQLPPPIRFLSYGAAVDSTPRPMWNAIWGLELLFVTFGAIVLYWNVLHPRCGNRSGAHGHKYSVHRLSNEVVVISVGSLSFLMYCGLARSGFAIFASHWFDGEALGRSQDEPGRARSDSDYRMCRSELTTMARANGDN